MTDMADMPLPVVRPVALAWQRLAACWAAERERWILWLPVCFALGIGAYFALTNEPPLWLGIAAASCCVVALVAAGLLRLPALILVLAPLAAISCGFAAAEWRTIRVGAPVLRHATGAVELHGRVTGIEITRTGRRILIDRLTISGLARERTPDSVRLVARGEAGIAAEVGGFVATRAMIGPPPSPAAPDALDIQRLMFFRGIGGLGRTIGTMRAEPAAEGYRPDLAIKLAILRSHITARIGSILPGDTGAVAAALITGDRTTISEPVQQDMRNSGLAHLLVIAGLHLCLVAGFVLMVMRRSLALIPAISLRYPTKKWAAAAALLAVGGYSVLSGLNVPVQRAFVMFALAMIAILLDRKPISMRVIGCAALIVLVLEPDALTGPSFQMSFAAVVALIAAYEWAQPWFTARRRGGGFLAHAGVTILALLFTSVVTTIANAPFSAYHFDRIALYGIAANLIAVPLSGILIMPAAVISVVLMPFGLDRYALLPMGWGVDWVIDVAHRVAHWQGAVIAVPAMPVLSLALITLGCLWLFFWLQRWRWYGLGAVAAGIVVALVSRPPDLLVSSDGRLTAIRTEEGRLLLSHSATNLVSETWVARGGGAEPGSFASAAAAPDSALTCDGEGCVYRAAGQLVALSRTRRALEDDCRLATVLIATIPLRRTCPSPRLVIDRFDLWRNGAYALWLAGGRIEAVSDRQRRGLRPWSLPPEPRFEPSDKPG
jgi:competence protein ComEC